MWGKLLILLGIFFVIFIVIGAYRYKYNLERKAIVETGIRMHLNVFIRGHEDTSILGIYDYEEKVSGRCGGVEMRKKLLILLGIFLVIFIVIGAFRYKYNLEREAIIEAGTKISQEHIKEHFNSDFVITDYDIIHSSIDNRMYIDGYIKGHEDVKISVIYDYKNKEVCGVGGPKWFLNSEKKDIP